MAVRGIYVCALAALASTIGIAGCTKGGEARLSRGQESVARCLLPAKAEARTSNFLIELSELKVTMKVDASSRTITQTPRLQGRYKITNVSPGAVEVQGAIIEYIDAEGNPIAFDAGEQIVKALKLAQVLQPGEVSDRVLDLTIPKAAVKDLAGIGIDLVYVPSVLKRETLTLSERIE
jgi:hypothetical protein